MQSWFPNPPVWEQPWKMTFSVGPIGSTVVRLVRTKLDCTHMAALSSSWWLTTGSRPDWVTHRAPVKIIFRSNSVSVCRALVWVGVGGGREYYLDFLPKLYLCWKEKQLIQVLNQIFLFCIFSSSFCSFFILQYITYTEYLTAVFIAFSALLWFQI